MTKPLSDDLRSRMIVAVARLRERLDKDGGTGEELSAELEQAKSRINGILRRQLG